MPISYTDIVSHILSPQGVALVSSHVELVPEEAAEMVSEDDFGNSYSYGAHGGSDIEPPTMDFFGTAIYRSKS